MATGTTDRKQEGKITDFFNKKRWQKKKIPKEEKEENNRQKKVITEASAEKDNINDNKSTSVVDISSNLGGEGISDSEPEVSAVVPVAKT